MSMERFKPLSIENKDELVEAIVARLTEIAMSLRIRGDQYRAEKVELFKRTYFQVESNFKIVSDDGTIQFR